ncbi:MAG TPA: hypothetical protein VIA62_27680 [Thermoanaerobaculia bacterium]|nr:hypothetical protein [Thermoanaerobaculia bacterium]
MRKAVTFARRTGQWELLGSQIAPLLAEMPFLREIAMELDSLLVEAKALDIEQEVVRGWLQDVIHRRQGVEARGERLRRRAASHLRGFFGFASEELVRFGVHPRPTGPRGPRRKPLAEAPPVTAE